MTDLDQQPPKTVRVLITGKVQGVWFRGWTMEQAATLGLDGWVRNLSDGKVEAIFSGPAQAVDRMVERCRQGPPSARVGQVAVGQEDSRPAKGFHQRPTV